MAYHVTIIPADHKQPISTGLQAECPDLGQLQLGVGGHLEAVPHWYRHEGKRAVAFCNEEGKVHGLPVNDRACSLWIEAAGGALNDVLCGDIVIVAVDTEQEYEQL